MVTRSAKGAVRYPGTHVLAATRRRLGAPASSFARFSRGSLVDARIGADARGASKYDDPRLIRAVSPSPNVPSRIAVKRLAVAVLVGR